MRRINSFIVCILLIVVPSIYADSTEGAGILKNIIDNYKSVNNISGRIKQIVKSPLSSDIYVLNIIAKKPGYLKVVYDNIEQVFFADGDKFFIYNPANNKVFEYKLGNVEPHTDPQLLYNYIMDNYLIKLSSKEDNKLICFSENMSLAYPVIILWYDDSFYVKRLGLDDGGGNVFEFEILSLDLNANNSIDDFKYQFSVDAEYEYRGVIFPE